MPLATDTALHHWGLLLHVLPEAGWDKEGRGALAETPGAVG